MQHYQFFATTAKGLELLLVDELKALGATEVNMARSGVQFSGELKVAYKACLWSRLANHILYPLTEFKAKTQDELYDEIGQIDWLQHIRAHSSFRIDVSGRHESINHTNFIGQKAKDAIVDQIREETGTRPNIKLEEPDCVINIHVHRDAFNVSLCLSGESLHRRGYRLDVGRAPLKETLAAAILLRADWPKRVQEKKAHLIDPMCGSGTLLIEAAMIAYDIAPGLSREYFGFYGWQQHNESIWSEVEEEAETRRENALSHEFTCIEGYDIHKNAMRIAEENAERAGLGHLIKFAKRNAIELENTVEKKSGLIIFNPPYGERLNTNEEEQLKDLFQQVGIQIKTHFQNWDMAIFTSRPDLIKSIGVRSYKSYQLYNGALEAKLLKFHLTDEYFMRFETETQKLERQMKRVSETPSEHSLMFANRLKKNVKHLKKWAAREGISCYRLYDADLPDYAMAIDRYGEYIHIQEYQAGKDVDPRKAAERVLEAHYQVHQVLNIPLKNIHIKVRQKQKGNSQYKKLDEKEDDYIVEEGPAKFYVNFTNYLDTGLFIDHRLMRQKVAQASKGKTLLNLFAYTCTASVQAAIAGAKKITSVDMSNTYIEWGKSNFQLNQLSKNRHDFITSECFSYLDDTTEMFDVIFLDPPTFSNSKKMAGTLDTQRDHVALVKACMRHLKPEGVLFFSNNYRKFKLDTDALIDFDCKNISPQCLDEDFKRRPNIHHCFEIRHG